MTALVIVLVIIFLVAGVKETKEAIREEKHKATIKQCDKNITLKLQYEAEDAFRDYINDKEIPIGGMFDAITKAYKYFDVNPMGRIAGNGDLKRLRMNCIMEEFAREWERKHQKGGTFNPAFTATESGLGEKLAELMPEVWEKIAPLPYTTPVSEDVLMQIKEYFDNKGSYDLKRYPKENTTEPSTEDNHSRVCNSSYDRYAKYNKNRKHYIRDHITLLPGERRSIHDCSCGHVTRYAQKLITSMVDRELYDRKLVSLSAQYNPHADYWTRMEAEAEYRKLDRARHPERYAYLEDPYISEPRQKG